MRGDLHVNDIISLPNTVINASIGSGGSGDVLTVGAQQATSPVFQGKFRINAMRHIGSSEKPFCDLFDYHNRLVIR